MIITISLYSSDYIDNNNGTVTDKATGLIWQKCSIGQKNDKNCTGKALFLNWDDSIKQCESLNIESKKWRLPTKEELETIIEKGSEPSINTQIFPNTNILWYWSSTLYPKAPEYVWRVSFNKGKFGGILKTNTSYIRCVTGP